MLSENIIAYNYQNSYKLGQSPRMCDTQYRLQEHCNEPLPQPLCHRGKLVAGLGECQRPNFCITGLKIETRESS